MIIYLVLSQQRVQNGQTPFFAPRYIGEFPAEALKVARETAGEGIVDLTMVFSLQTGRSYSIDESAGTPYDPGKTIVYACWLEPDGDQLVEKFYGEWARWNCPPREVQQILPLQNPA